MKKGLFLLIALETLLHDQMALLLWTPGADAEWQWGGVQGYRGTGVQGCRGIGVGREIAGQNT